MTGCDPAYSPIIWFRYSGARKPAGELCCLKHSRPDMANVTRHFLQLGRDLPSPWAHDKNGFSLFVGHHAYRGHQVGVVRDDDCCIKRAFPGIIQQIGSKVHIGTLLLHCVKLSDEGISNRCTGFSPFSTLIRVSTNRQSAVACPGLDADLQAV